METVNIAKKEYTVTGYTKCSDELGVWYEFTTEEGAKVCIAKTGDKYDVDIVGPGDNRRTYTGPDAKETYEAWMKVVPP